MVMRFGLSVVLALLVISACATVAPAPRIFAAGYESTRITTAENRPVQLDIWYPAPEGEEAVHNYGISAGRVANGAAIADERLPLVLLSHGAMGAAVNYSWVAEDLARHGYLVLGVSHFGESPVFGPATLDPSSVSHFGDRTRDFAAALDFLLTRSAYASHVDPDRIGLIGHSSGGATALMLAGATLTVEGLADHCRSDQGREDKGCRYPRQTADPAQAPVPLGRAVRAIVALDPALGPGFSSDTLARISMPVLVAGSRNNDFIPFDSHAGRIMALLPRSEHMVLDNGEGHFVYLDTCTVPIDVMGVALCKDRDGVDRAAVHARLAQAIIVFFDRNLSAR